MTPPHILQFRVELQDIQPLIWRRIQVPDSYTFWDLHIAIQSAFGWNDSHLHEFQVPAGRVVQCFGIPMDKAGMEEPESLPGWQHRVADYLSPKKPRAIYWYDFGDDWYHAIQLEEVLPPAAGKKYPRCVAGERSGPPDDCGGPYGYQDLLAILADPGYPEHASLHRWAAGAKGRRGKFDPEAFDEQKVKFDDPARRLKWMLDGI
ncbi:MAG: plasmid pRiA4b ORF-3 family protein [Nevskia sp.]|nr:plasmid pRiA4b ORF-3 family protein [Nevskia sp.]